MDIFEPVVTTDRQHAYFHELVSGKHAEKMALLQSWADQFQDRDGKFVIEFQTTFNSSFWELYLNVAFQALGANVDLSHSRPDFLLRFPSSGEVVAEATITSNADGYAPQWQPDFVYVPPAEAMREYQSLRLSNALSAKLQKYTSSYNTLPHVMGKPFLICVAPFEQQWSNSLGDRALRRVLFGVDVPLLDTDSHGAVYVIGEAHAERAWKPSGAEIPFGLFRDARAADISGVLFSSLATFGKLTALAGSSAPVSIVRALRYNASGTAPRLYAGALTGYTETLLDGLHLFVNPFAKVPLDTSPFAQAGVAVHTFSPNTQTLASDVPDGFLFVRTILSVFANDATTGAKQPNPHNASLKRPNVVAFPEAVLHRVGGGVGTTTDTHLAHYRGWTVLVARDVIDDDWGALARPGLFRSADAFREANRSDDSQMLMIPDWQPTKELALSSMLETIDGAGSTQ